MPAPARRAYHPLLGAALPLGSSQACTSYVPALDSPTTRSQATAASPIAVQSLVMFAPAPYVPTCERPSAQIFAPRREFAKYSAEMAIEDKDTATDLSVAPVVGPDDPRRFTDSGIEVKTLYTSADLPENLDLGQPGEFPYTRGVHAEMYRKRRWTMRQYAGLRVGEGVQRALQVPARARLAPGSRMAFDLPTQLGLDSDDPRSLGEVGRTGVAIDTLDDMRTAFDGIPLDEVSTSMTINAPAAVLLLLYELVAEEQGIESQQAQRHGAERHPQGVHRPRELHLPARALHAADHGPVRLLQGEHPEVEHGQHLRLPLPREGGVRGPGGRVHARERHGLRAGRARRRPAGGRLRAPPGVLLQRPQQRLPGGREVPRGPQHVGARDARALRGQGPEVADAALPHADRRRHADRPAAAQQRRPRRPAGLRRRLRRHAVTAHQRLRRGARAPDPSAPPSSRSGPSR